MEFDLQRFSAIQLPATKYNTYEAKNSVIYKIKTTFTEEATPDADTHVVRVLTKYGDDDEYEELAASETHTITPGNYNTYESDLDSIYQKQVSGLTGALGKLIGTVTAPVEQSDVYTTKSGKQFYMRMEYAVVRQGDEEAVVSYTAYYKTGTSAETMYMSTGMHQVTVENYDEYQDELIELSKTAFRMIRENVAIVWDVDPPGDFTRTFTTGSSVTYYIKAHFFQGEYTESFNLIEYTITYGTSQATNESLQYNRSGITIDRANVDTFAQTLVAEASTDIDRLIASLNVPNIVCADNASEVYTVGGFNYALRVAYEKGQLSNQVMIRAYIDEQEYGYTSPYSFNTQAEADAWMASTAAGYYERMKEYCDKSPENRTSQFDNSGYSFKIVTMFTKAANSLNVVVKTFLDDGMYSTSTVKIDVLALDDSIAKLWIEANAQSEKLKNEIRALNNNVIEDYVINDDVVFLIEVKYLKSYVDKAVLVEIYCDGVLYDSFTGMLIPANLESTNTSIKTMVDAKVVDIKTWLDRVVPKNETMSVTTKDNMTFTLGTVYTKASGVMKYKGYATIDGVRIEQHEIDWETYGFFEDAMDSLKDGVNTNLLNAKTLIEGLELPKESDSLYINTMGYTTGLSFSKTDDRCIEVVVTLDGEEYYGESVLIDVGNLEQSVSNIISMGVSKYEELQEYVKEHSPRSIVTDYEVDGFTYKLEIKYSKTKDNPVTSVSISLDGNIVDAFTYNISAATVMTDIPDLLEIVADKKEALEDSLIGIPPIEDECVIGNSMFSLSVQYLKDNVNNTLRTQLYLDRVIVKEEVSVFDPLMANTYTATGQRLINETKAMLASFPIGLTQDFDYNNLKFTVGYSVSKNLDSTTVQICGMVDGSIVTEPIEKTYSFDNLKAITDVGTRMIDSVIDMLKRYCPVDHTDVVTNGDVSYSQSITYTKERGSSEIIITSAIDGQVQETQSMEFDLTNTSEIEAIGDELSSNATAIIGQIPQSTTEEFVVRRFAYTIAKTIKKAYGENNIIAYVTVDDRPFGEQFEMSANDTDYEPLDNFLDNTVTALKQYLQEITPENFHMNYTRGTDVFSVDCYFSKKAGSNEISAEYVIDDA